MPTLIRFVGLMFIAAGVIGALVAGAILGARWQAVEIHFPWIVKHSWLVLVASVATTIVGALVGVVGLQSGESPPTSSMPTPVITSVSTSPAVRIATIPPSSFVEEFVTGLDGSRWGISGPTTRIVNGAIHLESTSAVFPFIYTNRNPFPTEGNFVFETSLRYPSVTGCGAGLAVTTVIPPLGSESDRYRDILRIWQDDGQKLTITFGDRWIYNSPGIDQSQHKIELRYDGKYYVMVDGKTYFTSGMQTNRPSALWFGNPFIATNACDWSQLEIDYIRIKSSD